MSKKNYNNFGDSVIRELFPSPSLSQIFEARIKELEILPTNALDIIGVEYRALQGILNGTSKRVDSSNFQKLATFLKLDREQVFALYMDELEKNFPDSAPFPQNKIDFINKNFDLAALRKAGLIKNLNDYWDIERRINRRFGFKSIFEYQPIRRGIAFSAGTFVPKNLQSRELWIEGVIEAFEVLNNPFEYSREKLIKYIPSIRWHSINVQQGLIFVIKALYRLGISVIYQSPFSTLHLRGATVVVNDKPCIVLTNYKGFYPTLWFALMHELCHVLFDLEEIRTNKYHISDEDPEDLLLIEKEAQANDFAREYFFGQEKAAKARPHINNQTFVNEFAEVNHVHPSFIYVFHAFYENKDDKKSWSRAQVFNPDFSNLINPLDLKWSDERPIEEHMNYLKETIYN